MPSVIGLGDLHLPWPDKRAIKAAIAYIKHRRPNCVVQLGDLADFYSSSRFARSLNLLTPLEEHKRARAQAEELWQRVREAAGPRAEFFQILGNHDQRPLKRILEAAPDLEQFVKDGLRNFWTFERVKTVPYDETLLIDDVLYTHGEYGFGQHISKYRMCVVTGHLHKGAVTFERIALPNGDKLSFKTIFEANAGYLGDPMSLPMRYRPKRDFFNYTKGLIEIDDFGPRFVSLEV